MVVLVRRASYEPDDAEWFDEDEDDYYEDEEDETSVVESSPQTQVHKLYNLFKIRNQSSTNPHLHQMKSPDYQLKPEG